ncbi:MAG: serine protease [Bacteroidetes bacterium]|nr:serine protease [Bacteroidota bacterium]
MLINFDISYFSFNFDKTKELNTMEIFSTMEPLLKTFWFIAIPISVIFLIQTVMTFVGANSMDGVDADFDGNFSDVEAPFQLFSFRNLINFLLGFGWSGVAFYTTIKNPALLITVAVIVGVAFILIFFFIIRQLLKLAEDNSFNIENTLNKTADVYLTIPAKRSGKGKILVSVNGSVHELEALTDGEQLPSGTPVKIVKIENNNILIAEKI